VKLGGEGAKPRKVTGEAGRSDRRARKVTR
jgi:hypothetical protein